MHRIFRDIITEIIGFAVGHSGLDPSPGHPHAEVARVMVSTVALPGQFSLTVGGTPEFSTEDNKCVLKHSPFLQVLDQGCGWLIYIKTLILDFLGQVAVLIPAPVKDLNDSNPSFNESTGEERRVGKGAGLLRVWSIHLEGRLTFSPQISQLRHAALHSERHLILGDSRLSLRVSETFEGLFVELSQSVEHGSPVAGRHPGGVLHVENRISCAPQFDAVIF